MPFCIVVIQKLCIKVRYTCKNRCIEEVKNKYIVKAKKLLLKYVLLTLFNYHLKILCVYVLQETFAYRFHYEKKKKDSYVMNIIWHNKHGECRENI